MAQEIRDENPFYNNWHTLITPEKLEVNEGFTYQRLW